MNLEPSLRVGDRLGGHFVSGHVEAVGRLVDRHDQSEWSTLWFGFPAELGRYVVPKGSIAVDGVSLTLVEVERERFSVALIPHTLEHTTLGALGVGGPCESRNRPAGQVRPEAVRRYGVRRWALVCRGNRNQQSPTYVLIAPSFATASNLYPLASVPATSKQTISFLTRRFAEVGIEPRTRYGQNFLVDLNLQRLIVDRAQLDAHDVVLEVGTGTGALTALMAPRAAAVVTVEIDPRLFQVAREELLDQPNVVMLEFDALSSKSRFDPRVIDAVRAQLAAGPERRLKLVANLPYSVATPVIANLLASAIVPYSMTVTVQKELADRMAAQPGTKDFAALAVWIQSQCQVELVRLLPPSVFWPRPKVTSAVVHIALDASRRQQIPDLDFFHEFARSLFLHRRKFLRGVLQGTWKAELGKEGVDRLLAASGISPQSRADQLDIPTILRLCEAVRQALGSAPPEH